MCIRDRFCFLAHGEYQNVPKQNYEYRIPEAPFTFFSATANSKRCRKKNKSLRRIIKGVFRLLIRGIGKGSLKKNAYGDLEIRCFQKKKTPANKRRATFFSPAPKSRVAPSRRLLRKTAIWTQMLRSRNSATAN